jgi:hypothetical protein
LYETFLSEKKILNEKQNEYEKITKELHQLKQNIYNKEKEIRMICWNHKMNSTKGNKCEICQIDLS